MASLVIENNELNTSNLNIINFVVQFGGLEIVKLKLRNAKSEKNGCKLFSLKCTSRLSCVAIQASKLT